MCLMCSTSMCYTLPVPRKMHSREVLLVSNKSSYCLFIKPLRAFNARLQVAGCDRVARAVRVCECIQECVERPLHELHKRLLQDTNAVAHLPNIW